MKSNTLSNIAHRENAKTQPLTEGKTEIHCKHEDEQTVKYSTPKKTHNQKLLNTLDQDNEATVTFQRFHNKSLASKAPCILNSQEIVSPSTIADAFCASHINPRRLVGSLPRGHQYLLDILTKIDGYLEFMATFRRKQNDLFRNIRKNLFDNFNINADFSKIKNILYLLPHAYDCTKASGQSNDIRMSLPKGRMSTEFRRNELTEAIYKYIEDKHKEFLKKNMLSDDDIPPDQRWMTGFDPNIDIPFYEFDFEKQKSPKVQPYKRSPVVPTIYLEQSLAKQKKKVDVLEPLSFLKRDKLNFFKDQLLKIVQQKQQKMKEQMKVQQQKGEMSYLNTSCYVLVCENLNLLFLQKRVSNMFLVTVIEQICKRMNFTDKQISHMIEKISQKCGEYLEIMTLSKGKILKLNRLLSNEAIKIINSQTFLI